MAHTKTGEQQTSNARPLWPILHSIAALIAAARAKWQARATRRAIAELSADQLADIGWPEARRPVLDVKAGLIAHLMSMQ
jgi:uncharacterized protein YjiS (DUF1127 family)